jgi:predicted branched-subunit amino acid permease
VTATTDALTTAPAAGTGRARTRELRAGARAILPMVAGVAPFGFAIGATVADRDLGLAGWATSPLLFAGASQMAVIDLLDRGASVVVVVATVVAVNARFALFAAALAPHWRETGARFRAAASYAIVDQLTVVALERYARDASPGDKRSFWTGAAVTLWVAWIGATTVGLVVGGSAPPGLALDLAMPLAVIGLVGSSVRDRDAVYAVLLAALVAVAASGLPYRSGVLVAAGAATAAVAVRRGAATGGGR